MQITTRSGAKLVHLQPNRKGDPELPLSDAELRASSSNWRRP
jgi:hypothetical protein